jgi:hypothetical protein
MRFARLTTPVRRVPPVVHDPVWRSSEFASEADLRRRLAQRVRQTPMPDDGGAACADRGLTIEPQLLIDA